MARAVGVENPRFGVWIVRLWLALGPFGHFGREDIEVAVAVNVSEREGVAVDDVSANQIMADPGFRIFRIACAVVPFERPDAIAGRDDNLGIFAGLEFRCSNAPANRRDLGRFKAVATEVLEPVVASEQIDFAIAVNVSRGDSFGVLESAAFTGAAGKNIN